MIETKNASEALANVNLRALVVGPPGSGKTHFIGTAPKVYYLGFSLGETDTFAVKNDLKQNFVKVCNFVPENIDEVRQLFGDLDKGIGNGAIHAAIKEAKELYKKGEVKTLAVDTVTFLVEHLWLYINEFCKKVSYSGEVDKRGLFGELNTMLSRLIGLDIISFPGNLIISSHEMLESDEAMDKKPDKSSTVVANILGGFRNKIEGMVSMVLYLTKLEKGGNYEYWCRTNKGNSRNAKSRIPIATTISDISYGKIMEEVNKIVNKKEGGK